MNFKKRFLFVLVVLSSLVLSVASCSSSRTFTETDLVIETTLGNSVPIRVELARTNAEQERGYMERVTIPDGTGMIFVYTADRQMYFWMKNTPHPLSIAFIDSTGVIREIRDLTPFSKATVSSSRSVRYALEVPAGWFSRSGIKTGDRIRGIAKDVSLNDALLSVKPR